MKEIHLRDIKGRKLEDLSPNELRAKLYLQGGEIPETIKTKKELIDLVKEKCN
jgi:hypothetical protein